MQFITVFIQKIRSGISGMSRAFSPVVGDLNEASSPFHYQECIDVNHLN
jgi:hypothetical protein